MFSDETKLEIITCKIRWKIHDLNKLSGIMKNDQFLTSKQFYNQKFPSAVFELRVYPNYPDKHRNARTGISLVNVQHKQIHDALRARCIIYLLDSNGARTYVMPATTFDLKELTESDKYIFCSHAMFQDGSYLLFCEIDFLPFNKITFKNVEIDNTYNKHSTINTSQESLTDMFEEGTLSDCLIKVGDETIKAHRCILAQNSKVFLRMFEQKGMKEAQKGEIKIVDSSPECFRAMIEYFYSGEITKINFEKLVDDLYVIAHKYEVLTLMDKCESFMSLNIDAANFTKRCHYAGLYGLPMLEKACIKYIFDNKNFLISNEWNEFKIANSTLAFRLLESVVNYDLIKY
ncbi:hypothetical protein ACQ4LE_000557 [Meloidogyne hapla]